MQYVYFALAGLLLGGAIAMRRQRRLWVALLLGVFALVALWAGLVASSS